MTTVKRVLFICQQNRLRSPTAEALFRDQPGWEVRSAGLAAEAVHSLDRELLAWADLVFVMERRQRNRIHKDFPDLYRQKRIICLYIPDMYDYMDPELQLLLRERVGPYLEESTAPPVD
ncbi:MAG: phosphotyrosine protein phosphatase [Acidobacteria bacterium]|nr:phosphotyrosine protein phosphatase [Acidobacteriota bacterium]